MCRYQGDAAIVNALGRQGDRLRRFGETAIRLLNSHFLSCWAFHAEHAYDIVPDRKSPFTNLGLRVLCIDVWALCWLQVRDEHTM